MSRDRIKLVLYSKPGCHLCEGLQEKLEQMPTLQIELEIRDITTRDDWFAAYQYEIPVLCRVQPANAAPGAGAETASVIEQPLPRLSPRANAAQVEKMLQKYLT